MVFQQLIKQRKETLAGTKLLLKELYVKVVDLPWVYSTNGVRATQLTELVKNCKLCNV